MKRTFFILIGLFLAITTVRAEEIRFEQGTWAESLAKAKSANKLVFLDAYTSWCGPCKWMARTTFTNPEVASFFNEHFVNVSFDMEKGEGLQLAQTYSVNAYPTLIFVDGDGALMDQKVGALDAEKFLEWGRSVAGGSVSPVVAMQKRWDAGERDRAFLHDYIIELANLNMNYMAPLDVFKEGMKGDALMDPLNWDIFKNVFRRHTSDQAKYFLSHRAAFEAKLGKDEVQQKAAEMYNFGLFSMMQTKDEEAFRALQKELRESGIEGAEMIILHSDFGWARANENWADYAKYMSLIQKGGGSNAPMLNDVAWTLYENVDDKKLLKQALVWAEASVAEDKGYANMDTKAMLLKKLGRKDEAIAAAKEAIELAKATGEPYEETEAALNEMLGK